MHMENLKRFNVVIAYFISFVILASSYIPNVGISEAVCDDVQKAYKSTKISDYYNLIALLPIKLVNKFVSNNIDIKNNIINKKASDKKNDKNKKTHNGNFDKAFVNGTINKSAGSFNDFSDKFISVPEKLKFTIYAGRISINIVYFLVILIFGFRLLARGDTEDYIINNKNRERFRLV
ncbi:hypothetical protein MASR1M68_08230 [Elusimicrobiota bacterium]